MLYRIGLASLVFGLVTASVAGQTTQPTTKPSETKAPESAINAVKALLEPPERSMERAELMELMKTRLQRVLSRGRQIERQYPDATNLHELRSLMLQAAVLLDRQGEPGAEEKANAIARRMLNSEGPAQAKLQADFHLLRGELSAEDGPTPEETARKIRSFVERYAETDAKVGAMVRGVVLAHHARDKELFEELLDELEEKHVEDAEARRILRQAERSPDVGRPFEAELTRLNGEKLTLPEDLLGKVVVVDFWATWCGPCVASIPHMKEVYEKYNDRGVEIVGISLDRRRSDLVEFLDQRDLPWIQTFSGEGGDPTADRYGIRAIPSVWVVGKDGKVVSDSARGHLENVIQQALAAEPPAPETRPAEQAD